MNAFAFIYSISRTFMSKINRSPPLIALAFSTLKLEPIQLHVREPLFSPSKQETKTFPGRRGNLASQLCKNLGQLEILLKKLTKLTAMLPTSMDTAYESVEAQQYQRVMRKMQVCANQLRDDIRQIIPAERTIAITLLKRVGTSYPLSAQVLRESYLSSDIDCDIHNNNETQQMIDNSRHKKAAPLRQNAIFTIACRLYHDVSIPMKHKHIAHQLALLYHCISFQDDLFSRLRKDVESHFGKIQKATAAAAANQAARLEPDQALWVNSLCMEIIRQVTQGPTLACNYSKTFSAISRVDLRI